MRSFNNKLQSNTIRSRRRFTRISLFITQLNRIPK